MSGLSTGVFELKLPQHLGHLAAKGIVSLLRTIDGRHLVLVKTSIGCKGNFEATLCCDAPLRATELVGGRGERRYVSIENHASFQEVYLRDQHDTECFEVYFDLN